MGIVGATILSSVIAGLVGAIGAGVSMYGQNQANQTNQNNFNEQMNFQQNQANQAQSNYENQFSQKVQSAEKAGLSPLAALGVASPAQTVSAVGNPNTAQNIGGGFGNLNFNLDAITQAMLQENQQKWQTGETEKEHTWQTAENEAERQNKLDIEDIKADSALRVAKANEASNELIAGMEDNTTRRGQDLTSEAAANDQRIKEEALEWQKVTDTWENIINIKELEIKEELSAAQIKEITEQANLMHEQLEEMITLFPGKYDIAQEELDIVKAELDMMKKDASQNTFRKSVLPALQTLSTMTNSVANVIGAVKSPVYITGQTTYTDEENGYTHTSYTHNR